MEICVIFPEELLFPTDDGWKNLDRWYMDANCFPTRFWVFQALPSPVASIWNCFFRPLSIRRSQYLFSNVNCSSIWFPGSSYACVLTRKILGDSAIRSVSTTNGICDLDTSVGWVYDGNSVYVVAFHSGLFSMYETAPGDEDSRCEPCSCNGR